MHTFWLIVINNAAIVCLLALMALALERFWKNAAALRLIWIAILVKLFLPPLFTAELPLGEALFSAESPAPRARLEGSLIRSELAAPQPDVESSSERALADRTVGEQTSGAAEARGLARGISVPAILASVWALGTTIVALLYAVQICRFRNLIRRAQPASASIRALAGSMGDRLGLRSLPLLETIDVPLPPLVWSFIGRPRVILPEALFARLGSEAKTLIVAHELAHVRRGDHRARLLELAATTLFWWHPVTWYACAKIRELEEQCCDRRVLVAAPQFARFYACALVDTLEFLSEHSAVAVPLPTAATSTGALTRRIRLLSRPTVDRLSIGSVALATVLVAVPMAVALSPAPQQTVPQRSAPQSAPQQSALQTAPDQNSAVVSGQVKDDRDMPLAGVRVRAAVPAVDMRFESRDSQHRMYEALTDKDGRYQILLPGVTQPTNASIDAMKPGFRTLWGMPMIMGDFRKVDLSPGGQADASFALEQAQYVKGVVVDEQGRSIAGADVNAQGVGWVQQATAGDDGGFEIFNYPLTPTTLGTQHFKGVIVVSHQDYIPQRSKDIYEMTREERESLRIVLPAGRKVTGRVIDASGQPVVGVMVEARLDQGWGKAVFSGEDGRFALRGLEDGPTNVRAHALPLKQKKKVPVDLTRDVEHFELRLEPVQLKVEPRAVSVLGMKLADVTPELQAAYDLGLGKGAVILDPGKNSQRLNIGELVEGYSFIYAGNDQNRRQLSGVREFLETVLTNSEIKADGGLSCRVVYLFRNLEGVGNNTQYLLLTKEEVDEVQTVLSELPDN